MFISVVINVDSRQESDHNQSMFNGVVSRDFMYDNIINKRNLFKGFDAEFVVFVDEHLKLTEKELFDLREVSDTLIIRKHDKRFDNQSECSFYNDMNYLTALFSARGEYIFHFDGDVSAFTESDKQIQEFIDLLETYDYISYPSHWSPHPVADNSWDGKFWVSTRFFCCKRQSLNVSEVLKCQLDYDYWKEKYPMARLCHWTEHILGSFACNGGKGVYYPPMDLNRFILFTWGSYNKYTLQRLNNQTYQEVLDFVSRRGIGYPNDLHC